MSKDFVPIRIDRRAPAADAERFPVFYITDESGEEREYTAPVRVSAGVALKALSVAATQGYVVAAGTMVNEALGEEAINALYACPQLTHEEAKAIMTRLSALFWGQAEELATGDETDGTPGN